MSNWWSLTIVTTSLQNNKYGRMVKSPTSFSLAPRRCEFELHHGSERNHMSGDCPDKLRKINGST